jgi:hypothetical protein
MYEDLGRCTLQKSMDLTPLLPNAGPTGGEGEAWPAPTMSLTIWSFAIAFLAIMNCLLGVQAVWVHLESPKSPIGGVCRNCLIGICYHVSHHSQETTFARFSPAEARDIVYFLETQIAE